MYAHSRVKVPEEKGKITLKRINGTTYLYYILDRDYDSEKSYSVPKSITIGKCCEDDPTMMVPNQRYLCYYPQAAPEP